MKRNYSEMYWKYIVVHSDSSVSATVWMDKYHAHARTLTHIHTHTHTHVRGLVRPGPSSAHHSLGCCSPELPARFQLRHHRVLWVHSADQSRWAVCRAPVLAAMAGSTGQEVLVLEAVVVLLRGGAFQKEPGQTRGPARRCLHPPAHRAHPRACRALLTFGIWLGCPQEPWRGGPCVQVGYKQMGNREPVGRV